MHKKANLPSKIVRLKEGSTYTARVGQHGQKTADSLAIVNQPPFGMTDQAIPPFVPCYFGAISMEFHSFPSVDTIGKLTCI